MPNYRVELRMLALATGVEWIARQEVEAPTPEAAAELAGMRASRGHSRSVPRETIVVTEIPVLPPRPSNRS